MAYDVSRGTVYGIGQPTPIELRQRFAYVVNVRACGARGDGVTDDTAAFRSAVAQAAAAGKPVYVPLGVYPIDGIVLKTGQRIYGEGFVGNGIGWYISAPATASTLKARSATVTLIEVDGDTNGYSMHTEIDHLALLGPNGSAGFPTHVSAPFTAWASVTHYVVGDRRKTVRGDIYEVITEGDSAVVGTGPYGFDSDIIDGTVHWKYCGLGHGIYFHGGPFGISGVDVHHVVVGGMPGKGIMGPRAWFTTIGPTVHTDACADNHIELDAGVGTGLDHIYFHRVAADKCGLRVHSGALSMRAVNGIDASGAGASCYIFGDNVTDDGVFNACYPAIDGCNVEYIPKYGIWLKEYSTASIRGTTFIGSVNDGVALQVDYANAGMTLDPSCTFLRNPGVTWKNGRAVHFKSGSAITFGVINGVWDAGADSNMAYNDTYGRDAGMANIQNYADALRITSVHVLDVGFGTSWDPAISAVRAHGARQFTGITWSASPVADGAATTVVLAFPGAANAQRFTATFSNQYVPAGILIQASCSSAGNVAVTILNHSGAPYTPPTGTLVVEIWYH